MSESAEAVIFPKKRGPKSRHGGMFTKNDPRICRNKNAREPIIAKAQRLASESLDESLTLLVNMMRDDTRSDRTRFDCAVYLISRAAGSPVSVSVLADIGSRQGLKDFDPLNSVGAMNGHLSHTSLGQAASLPSLSDQELESICLDHRADQIIENAEFEEVSEG